MEVCVHLETNLLLITHVTSLPISDADMLADNVQVSFGGSLTTVWWGSGSFPRGLKINFVPRGLLIHKISMVSVHLHCNVVS